MNMTPRKSSLCYVAVLVTFMLLIGVTNSLENQDDSEVCKQFNKSSGLSEFCGYDSTAGFINRDQFGDLQQLLRRFKKLDGSCADIIKLMQCSVWFPRCVPEVRGPFLPCRRVCHHMISECAEEVRNISQIFYWNMKYHCQLLPEKDEPGTKDFRKRCFEPPNFKSSLRKGDIEPRKCFPIYMSSCKNLGYNFTFISKETQEYMWSSTLGKLLNKHNNTVCNTLRKILFCSDFAPPCYADQKVTVSPCRETCNSYLRNKCSTRWLTIKNCNGYPKGSSPNGYCTTSHWYYADSWLDAYAINAKISGSQPSGENTNDFTKIVPGTSLPVYTAKYSGANKQTKASNMAFLSAVLVVYLQITFNG